MRLACWMMDVTSMIDYWKFIVDCGIDELWTVRVTVFLEEKLRCLRAKWFACCLLLVARSWCCWCCLYVCFFLDFFESDGWYRFSTFNRFKFEFFATISIMSNDIFLAYSDVHQHHWLQPYITDSTIIFGSDIQSNWLYSKQKTHSTCYVYPIAPIF